MYGSLGSTYAMGGLTGVGTYPEYSNMGLDAQASGTGTRKYMKERGQDICYLYPYSIPYYRRKGWEIISDKISYEIKDYQLPKNHQVPGDVRRVNTESDEAERNLHVMPCEHMVQFFVMIWHGMSTGFGISDDIMSAVYYNEKNEPDGYVIYWIAKRYFILKI